MTSTLKLGSKIPISEIEGDISEASGMTGFLDDDMTRLSQAGKEAVFNSITVDLSSGVSISNNGAMPFDGWAFITISVWGTGTNSEAHAFINDARVGGVVTGANGSGNNASIFVPVQQGDIFKLALSGSNRSGNCKLYPYKNSQEAA
ncbi:MAG TPA: hypothetical protein H9673_05250 [Candidatus Adamsella sp.]|nr:hypothetical protein [Candidatus Adamsella sp.]